MEPAGDVVSTMRQLLLLSSMPDKRPAISAWAAADGKISQAQQPKTAGDSQFLGRRWGLAWYELMRRNTHSITDGNISE